MERRRTQNPPGRVGRKRGPSPVDKMRGDRMPYELDFKKELAVILKIANYTPSQIGNAIGERKSTIKSWLEEPAVKEKYYALSKAIPTAALAMIETYTIEAFQTIVDIMRTTTDDKLAGDMAKEILNRGGLPAIAKSESSVKRTEEHTFSNQGIVDALRQCSPEVQEKAAELVEQTEAHLAELIAAEDKEMVIAKATEQLEELATRKVGASEESAQMVQNS